MQTDRQLSSADRKHLLLLQGQVFRAGLVLAQHDVREALQPRALLRGVAAKVMGNVANKGADAARHLMSLQSLMDGRLAALLPLAGKSMRLLGRYKLMRPLALTLLAAGLGYAGWHMWQRRRRQADQSFPDQYVADTDAAQEQAAMP